MSVTELQFFKTEQEVVTDIPGTHKSAEEFFLKRSLTNSPAARGKETIFTATDRDYVVSIKNIKIWFDDVSEDITEFDSAVSVRTYITIGNETTDPRILHQASVMIANSVIQYDKPDIQPFLLRKDSNITLHYGQQATNLMNPYTGKFVFHITFDLYTS